MDSIKKRIRPFVKWAGGKTQLLESIHELAPKEFNRIVEPFVGGGSVFLSFNDKPALINDLNKELITTYRQVKRSPCKLLRVIDQLVLRYNQDPQNQYLAFRDHFDFNQWPINWKEACIGARFVFINKTCFNGLYRVNSSGVFNVPWNKRSHVSSESILEEENIMKMHHRLQNVRIFNRSYHQLAKELTPDDFVFVDPPYDSDTTTFNSYTKDCFGKQDQVKLSQWLDKLTQKGIKWMLTNHDTKLIRELYGKYHINLVTVNRFINSVGSKRSQVTQEVIITNY